MFSVMPLPKAAPSPSFFGRCISTTSVSKMQTITRIESRIGMIILSHIRVGNMECGLTVVKVLRKEPASRSVPTHCTYDGSMLSLAACFASYCCWDRL